MKPKPKVNRSLPAKTKRGEFMWDLGLIAFDKKELPRFKKGDHENKA